MLLGWQLPLASPPERSPSACTLPASASKHVSQGRREARHAGAAHTRDRGSSRVRTCILAVAWASRPCRLCLYQCNLHLPSRPVGLCRGAAAHREHECRICHCANLLLLDGDTMACILSGVGTLAIDLSLRNRAFAEARDAEAAAATRSCAVCSEWVASKLQPGTACFSLASKSLDCSCAWHGRLSGFQHHGWTISRG